MRALFLILLSANLLFLAWAQWIDGPRDAGAQDSLAGLPRLKLVSERGAGNKPTAGPSMPAATATLATAEKTALHVPATGPSCTSVGPFNDIASAARVAGLLTGRGFHLQQRAEEGDTIEGYWVFVGSLASDEDVGKVVEQLNNGGFTDAHVMKNFSTNRRVSVGMFSTRERAEKRAEAVKRMGLRAEIGERKFTGTVYWVDVPQGADGKALPPEYSFAEIGHAKVTMQPCPPGVRPAQPLQGEPADAVDGITKVLPRTTVASAPRRER